MKIDENAMATIIADTIIDFFILFFFPGKFNLQSKKKNVFLINIIEILELFNFLKKKKLFEI